MINSVRNTVLAVLNKNNYGYMSPSDFNLFAKQAQLDIFEDYFMGYNLSITKQNARKEGEGYADKKKNYEEMIERFLVTDSLTNVSYNTFLLPSIVTTGYDYYMIRKCLIKQALANGTTTDGDVTENRLIDTNADFSNVSVGDIVWAYHGGQWKQARVTSASSTTELATDGLYFITSGIDYIIYKRIPTYATAEKVSQAKIDMLNNSLLTAPSIEFPAYVQAGSTVEIYPDATLLYDQVSMQYVRYPKVPKWTYISIGNGEPIFDQSNADYQDFEIHAEDEPRLVSKILQYAGVSIREPEVVRYYQGKEIQEIQQEIQQ